MLTAVQSQNLATRAMRARAVSVDLFGGLLVPLAEPETIDARLADRLFSLAPAGDGISRRVAVSHANQSVIAVLNAMPTAGKLLTVLVPREIGDERQVRAVLRRLGLKAQVSLVSAPATVLYSEALRQTQSRVPGLAPAEILHIGSSRARTAGFDVMVVPGYGTLAGPFAASSAWDYGESELATFACAVGALALAGRPYDYWPMVGATQTFWFALEAIMQMLPGAPEEVGVEFHGPAAATLKLAADWLVGDRMRTYVGSSGGAGALPVRLLADAGASVSLLEGVSSPERLAALQRVPALVQVLVDSPVLSDTAETACCAGASCLAARGIQQGLLAVVQFLGGRPEWHALASSLVPGASQRLARIIESPKPLDAEALWPVLREPLPTARNVVSRFLGARQSSWPAGYRVLAQSGVRQ